MREKTEKKRHMSCYTECDINIYKNGKHVMLLDAGASAVASFYSMAEKGIKGAFNVKYSFSFNVDLEIKGEHLIPFIKENYPEKDVSMIIPDDEYLISCYDMS